MATVLYKSLSPSAQAKAALPKVGTRNLPIGHAQVVEWQGLKVFIYRTSPTALRVFGIPFRDGAYFMPDIRWGRAILPCAQFRTPIDNSGTVDLNGNFSCDDPRYSEWWHRELRWSINGKRLGQYVEDLMTPRYQLVDEYVILGTH